MRGVGGRQDLGNRAHAHNCEAPMYPLSFVLADEFPVWLRATHWINAFFIGFLIRAGI